MYYLAAAAAAGTAEAGGTSQYFSIFVLAAMLVAMYFVMVRPQRKKDKKQREMRESIEVGDGITTIGGVVGRVVGVKDDTILIETGSDRTKMRFQKWAIQDVEKLNLEE